MKNLSPIFLLLMGVIMICYALLKKDNVSAFHKRKTPTFSSHSMSSHSQAHSHAHHHSLDEKEEPVTVPAIIANSPMATSTAVSHMNSLLKTYALGSFEMSDVIEDLDKRNMDPLLLKDSNPHTGTMYVLRTESPLPGTRYFHAQYFTDDKKEPFLQHMSFDMKPEKTAFADAIQSIKKIFGQLGTPSINKKDFIMWPWKKGYNIWVQRLDKDQLTGDPFNAYAANDAGTVKIAIELDNFHDH
jgi:hypothetical protein